MKVSQMVAAHGTPRVAQFQTGIRLPHSKRRLRRPLRVGSFEPSDVLAALAGETGTLCRETGSLHDSLHRHRSTGGLEAARRPCSGRPVVGHGGSHTGKLVAPYGLHWSLG